MVWLTVKRRLALFPAKTIVRDPNHLESSTRREEICHLIIGTAGNCSSSFLIDKRFRVAFLYTATTKGPSKNDVTERGGTPN